MKMTISLSSKLSMVFLFGVMALLTLAAPDVFGEVMYSIIDLGTLGGTSSEALGINNDGQVVGWARTEGNTEDHAFLYSGGRMTDLGTLGGWRCSAVGINNSGQVVGYGDTSSGSVQAFLYSAGSMTMLNGFGGFDNWAHAINDYGDVVGAYGPSYGQLTSHGFLYSGGSMTDLDIEQQGYSAAIGINNFGEVVGCAKAHNYNWQDAILYSRGTLSFFSDDFWGFSLQSFADGINNNRQIIVNVNNGWVMNPYLYSANNMILLATLDGSSTTSDTYARGINDSGAVVGESDRGAFLYDGQTMRYLKDLTPPNSGWVLYIAWAINNNGQIVGVGVNPLGQYHGFLLTQPILGIDVSQNQGTINWEQVATADKAFAYVKATSGLLGNDISFMDNMRQGAAAELKMGAYHFAYPNYRPANTGRAEAQHFVNIARPYIDTGFLRPALDVEDDKKLPNYPMQALGADGLSDWIKEFADEVKRETAVDIIIYCTRQYARDFRDAGVSDLSDYPYWVVTNDDDVGGMPADMGLWSNWKFKQYRYGTDDAGNVTATCPGVLGGSGGCDLDSFNGDFNALNGLLIGPPPPPSCIGIDGGKLQPPSNGQFQMGISAPRRQQVTVQASDDMINWVDIATVPIVQGQGAFTDTSAGAHNSRFYRAKP